MTNTNKQAQEAQQHQAPSQTVAQRWLALRELLTARVVACRWSDAA
jgi:hypothetical protein